MGSASTRRDRSGAAAAQDGDRRSAGPATAGAAGPNVSDDEGVFAALEERGLPLGFHAAYNWSDTSLAQLNRFISVHALGFAFCNIIHMTNWIINGMPERFPRLQTVWIESGLAWVPFLGCFLLLLFQRGNIQMIGTDGGTAHKTQLAVLDQFGIDLGYRAHQ